MFHGIILSANQPNDQLNYKKLVSTDKQSRKHIVSVTDNKKAHKIIIHATCFIKKRRLYK